MAHLLQNKYRVWYDSLMERAKSRSISGYAERHHIIPRSFGGSDDKTNLVDLTAREHFLAHLILPKITQGEHKAKMIFALWRMCNGNGQQKLVSSRYYEKVRLAFSNSLSERMSGSGNPFFGKTHTEETRKNISKGQTGRRLSEEHKKSIGDSQRGISKPKHTESAKIKIRKARSLQVFSEESNLKRKESISKLIWVNDGTNNARVSPDKLNKYLDDGWVLGRTRSYITEEYKSKQSMTTKEQWNKRKGTA